LTQLFEKAGVLYGDNGLSRKVRHQLNMLAGKGPNLLAIDNEDANQLVFL
jgi:hypothetical protein